MDLSLLTFFFVSLVPSLLQVTSYSLSLYEIDTAQDSDRRGSIRTPSAIEIMVRSGHVLILNDPLVKTLMTTKVGGGKEERKRGGEEEKHL